MSSCFLSQAGLCRGSAEGVAVRLPLFCNVMRIRRFTGRTVVFSECPQPEKHRTVEPDPGRGVLLFVNV